MPKNDFNVYPQNIKEFENPHIYDVGISPGLAALRDKLITEMMNGA